MWSTDPHHWRKVKASRNLIRICVELSSECAVNNLFKTRYILLDLSSHLMYVNELSRSINVLYGDDDGRKLKPHSAIHYLNSILVQTIQIYEFWSRKSQLETFFNVYLINVFNFRISPIIKVLHLLKADKIKLRRVIHFFKHSMSHRLIWNQVLHWLCHSESFSMSSCLLVEFFHLVSSFLAKIKMTGV